MKVVGIIPARYGSTRLPGKPLMDIAGHPMIWWAYTHASEVTNIDNVYVATDDIRISDICHQYSIPVIMTSDQPTAAHRLHEVSETIDADLYIQINGDEPLLSPEIISSAIPDSVPTDIEYGTNIITEIKDPVLAMDPTNIKVVFDNNLNTLYMSRTPIPYPYKSINYRYYKHVGVIGYNKKMLDFYVSSEPGPLEKAEGIDLLRFIDYGKQLKLFIVPECDTLSVDTDKDLKRVRKMMKNTISHPSSLV